MYSVARGSVVPLVTFNEKHRFRFVFEFCSLSFSLHFQNLEKKTTANEEKKIFSFFKGFNQGAAIEHYLVSFL